MRPSCFSACFFACYPRASPRPNRPRPPGRSEMDSEKNRGPKYPHSLSFPHILPAFIIFRVRFHTWNTHRFRLSGENTVVKYCDPAHNGTKRDETRRDDPERGRKSKFGLELLGKDENRLTTPPSSTILLHQFDRPTPHSTNRLTRPVRTPSQPQQLPLGRGFHRSALRVRL